MTRTAGAQPAAGHDSQVTLPLRDLSGPGRRCHEPYPNTEPREHVDESVSAEEFDPAPKEIAHTRLCNAHDPRSLRLLEASGLEYLLNLDHEVGADSEVLGLFGGEAKVTEHVAA